MTKKIEDAIGVNAEYPPELKIERAPVYRDREGSSLEIERAPSFLDLFLRIMTLNHLSLRTAASLTQLHSTFSQSV